MEETNKLIKPQFNEEIKAEIKGVSKIENNILKVKDYATQLQEYYTKIIFTDESLKDATDEKAKINKFKNEVAEFRKNIIKQFNEPIALFENTAKETEKILTNTYELINIQVQNFNDKKKAKIKELSIEYFNEYAQSKNIDFLEYSQANINITLGLMTEKGELTKKAREEISLFIDNVEKDLELINEEELKTEILVEYKKTLNASNSILEVKRRYKAIEEEKQRQQELQAKKEQEIETIKKVEEVLIAPKKIEVKINEEDILQITFSVRGKRDELKELVNFLKERGYDYEQCSN